MPSPQNHRAHFFILFGAVINTIAGHSKACTLAYLMEPPQWVGGRRKPLNEMKASLASQLGIISQLVEDTLNGLQFSARDAEVQVTSGWEFSG